MKSVLITGCSTGGIGYSLAKSFQARGYHVFATARNVSKMAGLDQLPNITLLQLEVTSTTDIAAAVTAVEQSGHELAYLVNNAGIAPCMPAADVDIEEGKKVFDANVWGTLAVTQAFIPLLVRDRGTIITVASINAYINPAWMSIYSASKAAQQSLTLTMEKELRPLGVRFLTVATGVVATNVMTKQAGTFKLPANSLYKAVEALIRTRSEGEEKVPVMSPDAYAEKVVNDALAGKTGLAWRGRLASVIWFLYSYFPLALTVRSAFRSCTEWRICLTDKHNSSWHGTMLACPN